MTNEELVDQIQRGICPGENMEQLYRQNNGLILKIARRHAYGDDLEDLLQEAYFGLYEAVKRYEDTAGVLFMSYASYWIKQAITRYLENNGRIIRLPVALYNNLMRYKKLVSAFELQLGRKPTDHEVEIYLRINKTAIEAVKKAYWKEDVQSLDELIPGTDDILIGESVPDRSVDIENSVIDRMMKCSRRTELWRIVRDNVTEEENIVISARYRNNLSLEVTGQYIGKSKEMVRQIEAKALRKLRRSRITRQLEERFEVNYARAYRGSLGSFNYTWNSIVEEIALRNLEFTDKAVTKVITSGVLQ